MKENNNNNGGGDTDQLSDDVERLRKRLAELERANEELRRENKELKENQQIQAREKTVKAMARNFQLELFEEGTNNNVLVVAPTGSGKTIVSVLLAQHVLDMNPHKKVVFLVDRIPLVRQHGDYFKRLLAAKHSDRVGIFYADRPLKSWNRAKQDYDVMVMIAQVFLNSLSAQHDGAKLQDIQLLIFDEAHHTTKSHPFRIIMKQYYQPLKSEPRVPLPKVLGMTASPAAKTTIGETLLHLLQLCNDLDCRVRTVDAHKKDLESYINIPQVAKHSVPMDKYSIELKSSILRAIRFLKDELSSELEFGGGGDFSSDSYTDSYTPAECEAEIASIAERFPNSTGNQLSNQDGENQRIVIPVKTLAVLMQILLILDERSCKSAWDRWLEHVNYLQSQQGEFGSQCKKLLSVLTARYNLAQDKFNGIELPLHCNKRFKLLELLRSYKDSNEFRAVVFVKTRKSAEELTELIEAQQIPNIKAKVLLGHGVSGDSRMTAKAQQDVVEQFRKGELTVLVSTSVGEEGLDIPSCNIVVRMDGVDHTLQLIQSRGRARDQKSHFHLIYHTDSNVEERYHRFKMQEYKMNKAIQLLLAAEKEGLRVYENQRNRDGTTLKGIFLFIFNNYKLITDEGDDPDAEELERLASYSKLEEYQGDEITLLNMTCAKLLGEGHEPEFQFSREGPPHSPSFTYKVILKITDDESLEFTCETSAGNKQEAKRLAAAQVIKELMERDLVVFPGAKSEIFQMLKMAGSLSPTTSDADVNNNNNNNQPETRAEVKTQIVQQQQQQAPSRGATVAATVLATATAITTTTTAFATTTTTAAATAPPIPPAAVGASQMLPSFNNMVTLANAKNILQHYCFILFGNGKLPKYHTRSLGATGPFEAAVELPNGNKFNTTQSYVQKKDAEKGAALEACRYLMSSAPEVKVPANLLSFGGW